MFNSFKTMFKEINAQLLNVRYETYIFYYLCIYVKCDQFKELLSCCPWTCNDLYLGVQSFSLSFIPVLNVCYTCAKLFSP